MTRTALSGLWPCLLNAAVRPVIADIGTGAQHLQVENHLAVVLWEKVSLLETSSGHKHNKFYEYLSKS
jgi:hypothetical protein